MVGREAARSAAANADVVDAMGSARDVAMDAAATAVAVNNVRDVNVIVDLDGHGADTPFAKEEAFVAIRSTLEEAL